MKILSIAAIRSAEQETEVIQQLPKGGLMERAGRMLFNELQNELGECSCKAEILCGFGNNGGDGLVLARLLHEAGHQVTVYLLEHDSYSVDNLLNQQRLQQAGIPISTLHKNSIIHFAKNSIVLDALFGYGLSRLLDDSWAPLVRQINEAENTVYAIDMPSGLLADEPTPDAALVVKADRTYTLAFVKLPLLLPDYGPLTGDFVLLDIGIDQAIVQDLDVDKHYITLADVKKIAKPLHKFSHKGTFGHAVVAGGSYGSIGAVILASKSALRTGCGLVSGYIPKCGYPIMQATLPEALVKTDSGENYIRSFTADVLMGKSLALGMGLGTAEDSQEALHTLLKDIQQLAEPPQLLLDADALNILSVHPEWLSLLPAHTILTPHPKELQRLIGSWANDFEKLQRALAWAGKYQQILVIKGANTVTILPDGQLFFNSTGNPGMATGGAGDVLSGIIASLLAQGYVPHEAAILGVMLHGLAGDCAIKTIHQKSLTATDLIDHLSDAWSHILPL